MREGRGGREDEVRQAGCDATMPGPQVVAAATCVRHNTARATKCSRAAQGPTKHQAQVCVNVWVPVAHLHDGGELRTWLSNRLEICRNSKKHACFEVLNACAMQIAANRAHLKSLHSDGASTSTGM